MTGAALHVTSPIPLRPPRLALVMPNVDRRALRTAWVLDVFIEQCLSLDRRDARQVEKAFGWQPEASLRLGVRSAPSEVHSLVTCAELRRIVVDSDEWPAGFYVDPASNLLRFDLQKSYGLILPVWRKWPMGLQWYRHAKDERPRWISSASRETGTAAVASVHCQAMKREPAAVESVFMVTHTLEAMAVAIRQGVSAVGYNGAAAASVPAQMLEAFPALRGVVMAMKDPPPRLERELRDAGLSVTSWEGGALL
jgi:hypothetical protein